MKCSIATIGRSRGEQPRNFVYPMMKSALNPPCPSSMYRQYLWRRSQKGEEETSPGQGSERENCSFGKTFEPKYQLEGARAWDMIFGAARLLMPLKKTSLFGSSVSGASETLSGSSADLQRSSFSSAAVFFQSSRIWPCRPTALNYVHCNWRTAHYVPARVFHVGEFYEI
jgi:hypothetical protein